MYAVYTHWKFPRKRPLIKTLFNFFFNVYKLTKKYKGLTKYFLGIHLFSNNLTKNFGIPKPASANRAFK